MGAQRIKYKAVERVKCGKEIVQYTIENANGRRTVSLEQIAYLIGREQIENMTAQIYNGKLLFRGVGIKLDDLKTVEIKKDKVEVKEATPVVRATPVVQAEHVETVVHVTPVVQQTPVVTVDTTPVENVDTEPKKKAPYEIVGLIRQGIVVVGYTIKNTKGNLKDISRADVINAATSGKISNAVIDEKTGGLKGVGVSLNSLPVKKIAPAPQADLKQAKPTEKPVEKKGLMSKFDRK